MTSRPWGEDPSPLVATLQAMASPGAAGSDGAQKRTLDQKIDALTCKVDDRTK